MARKVYCNNTSCKFHCKGDMCDTTVKIGSNGVCQSFEKGFVYYFHKVWDALGNSNFIDMIKMNDDLRIGLFYVLSVYHIGFSEMEWGTCRMIQLKDGENGPPMKYEDIIAKGIDDEVFNRLYREFQEGKLPEIKKEKPKKESQPFGWLSPTGVFTEGDFAEHEEVACDIVRKKGWVEEFREWDDNSYDVKLRRDFLADVKGYCLIHNPMGNGGYVVSNSKPLTKKQKEFLYGYFMDIGDRFKAEQYIE